MNPGCLGQALAWGLAGLFVVPLIILAVSSTLRVSPACGIDTAACTADVASLMIMFTVPGAALVFVTALVWRTDRPPRQGPRQV